jgi:nucleotide-binding universal stress UspA family protein
MFRHILVPSDGSPLSLDAVARAISFAKETGARITFFCAVEPYPRMFYGAGAIFDAQAPATYLEMMRASANEILEEAERSAREAGVACGKKTLVSGQPYEAILEAAAQHGCDLIFMASHGRRGIKALVLGSETQKVLTHSSVPVLVFRQGADSSP